MRVEVAFGFGPYDPEPLALDWDDLSEHVMAIQTVRGRSSEFENFPAGTATITLFDDQRRFDPLNSAGPYYGQLKANTAIRIVAEIDSTDFPLWRGYTDGWSVDYVEGGVASEVTITAADAFKPLAERKYPDPYIAALDAIGRPDAWYQLDSTDDNVLRNAGGSSSSAIGKDGRITASVSTTDPLSLSSDGAVVLPALKSVDPNDPYVAAVELPILLDSRDNITAGDTWTISWLMRAVTRDPVTLFATRLQGLAYAEQLSMAALSVSPNGNANYPQFLLDYGSNFLGNSGQVDIGDGAVHHLVLVREITTARLYVDGALVASDTDGAVTGAYDASLGSHQLGRSPAYPAQGGSVVIDELMGWADRALDDTEVADLYALLTVPGTEIMPTGTAIDAVLDSIGWLSGLRTIDTGETLAQPPARPRGVSVLGLLQNYATAEHGRLFVDRSGRVTFHDRGRFLRETVESTIQYGFSDVDRDDPAPPDVGILDGTLKLALDDRHTFDAAAVTRAGGLTRTAGSATPLREWTADGLYLASDMQAASLAQWAVFRFGIGQPRSESWQVDPEVRPADWEDLLELEIGSRIRHTLTPGGIGSTIELDQHVAYIEHDITPERWLVTLNGTPTDPNEADYFLWDSSASASTTNGWADTDNDPPGGAWG
ncbi:MAG: hypothetical protein IT196_05370 [Acidimicrobiales bacterium]|nr:hypothetical protein [Acidimicrobiales bacterium]